MRLPHKKQAVPTYLKIAITLLSIAALGGTMGGYMLGENHGWNNGHRNGEKHGYNNGYNIGYDSGYEEAPRGYMRFEMDNAYKNGYEDARVCAVSSLDIVIRGMVPSGSIYDCYDSPYKTF